MRLAGSLPLLLSTFPWRASEQRARAFVCARLSPSRHAALLLPQYARSRIPTPHHNPYLCLSVIDLLAVLPPLPEVKYKPSQSKDKLVH